MRASLAMTLLLSMVVGQLPVQACLLTPFPTILLTADSTDC